MRPFSCLAIDMGAGSIRIVQGIFAEEFTMKEIYRFDNSIEWIDGAERWNLKKITDGITTGIAKAFEQSEVPVLSVGVDSWGVDFVLIGQDGEPLEDAVSYRDKRTIGMKEKWNELVSAEKTFQITGINYNIFNTLYQLFSLKDSAKLQQTKRILFMADYINYFLSGKMVNELTLGATSQMVNYRSADFDQEIMTLLGTLSQFEKPVLPGEHLGRLNNFGINKTEVTVVAGHDTACAVAAIPFTNENSAYIATGTWCIVGMLSDEALISQEAFELDITNEVAADGKFRPLKNLIGLWLIQQLRTAFGAHLSYSDIDELAASVPKSHHLVDTSDECFYNPENMKEAFDEYFNIHFSSTLNSEAEYYRCAYDSLVESFKSTLTNFEAIRGKAFDTIHIIGGGSQSKLLCQLTASATGMKVIAGPVEAAVTGNLMMQAKALGKMDEDPEIKKRITDSMQITTYLPK